MTDPAQPTKLPPRFLAAVRFAVLSVREFLSLNPVVRIATAEGPVRLDLSTPADFNRWLDYQFAPTPPTPPATPRPATGRAGRIALATVCLLALVTCVVLIDLKGISGDEGMRLGIINGNEPFVPHGPTAGATWEKLLAANESGAYQPLYFLLLNSLMRVCQQQDLTFFRLINVGFLAACLAGLLHLSSRWQLLPRLFLLGLFSFNAYLLMHVLQIREYIAGVAFYIWSTWLVLRLADHPLRDVRTDVPVFAAYGLLLTLGFYLQTWVVFPAIGQGLFLVLRRPAPRGRFLASLTLTYGIVLASTLPYLASHRQKMDIGLWSTENESLAAKLSDGFHLVLGGHLANHAWFTDFLYWFWLAVLAGTLALLFRRGRDAPGEAPRPEARNQAGLMLLCSGVTLTFQASYCLWVENLSVWPRYFIVHYFFLCWLVALGFNHLYAWRANPAIPHRTRRGLTVALGTIGAVLLASAPYQVLSYHHDPYFDTGTSRDINWPATAADLGRLLGPGDVVFTQQNIALAALTATRPLPNPVFQLGRMPPAPLLQSAARIVYVESGGTATPREKLATQLTRRLAALGFGSVTETGIRSAGGGHRNWRVLIFERS